MESPQVGELAATTTPSATNALAGAVGVWCPGQVISDVVS